jgi:hypothetical protein
VTLAGTGPHNHDGFRPWGKIGRDVTLEQANQHARSVGFQNRQIGAVLVEIVKSNNCLPQ